MLNGARSYTQRDGKLVTIDANGEAKRFLVSGVADPGPLAGLDRDGNPTRVDERVWDELGRRFVDEEPLTAETIAFARPTPETIAAFNRARAEWQKAMYALHEALGGADDNALVSMLCAAGCYDLDLAGFVEEASEDGYENPRLEALVNAVNEASGWLGAAVDNIAGAAS